MRKREWKRGLSSAFAVVGVGAAAFVIGHGFSAQANTSQQIQHERFRNIRDGCVAQNRRHDATIGALDGLLVKATREHPERRAQIRQSRNSTVLLIDALAPKHSDCTRFAQSQVDAGI